MATMTLTFLQQLVAQRTAFVQVKQEQEQQTAMDHVSDGIITNNNGEERSFASIQLDRQH